MYKLRLFVTEHNLTKLYEKMCQRNLLAYANSSSQLILYVQGTWRTTFHGSTVHLAYLSVSLSCTP